MDVFYFCLFKSNCILMVILFVWLIIIWEIWMVKLLCNCFGSDVLVSDGIILDKFGFYYGNFKIS